MPRKKIINQSEFPYHVYNRTIDKEMFKIPISILWDLFCHQAYSISVIWGARIHAAVLMGNHFHLLLSTPDSNLGECLQDFQSEIARGISLSLGTNGYRFSARYKWSIVQNEAYYRTVFKYIYQNPIRAGLSKTAQGYRYSTFAGLVGNSELKIPIYSHPFAPELTEGNPSEIISWVNEIYKPHEAQVIRSGFRFKVYSPNISKISSARRKEIFQF